MSKQSYNKKNIIEQLRSLAKDSEKYDVNKLPAIENKINSMTDDQINNALLLGEFQTALIKTGLYDWSQDELNTIRQAIESCGLSIKEVKKMEQEQGRDDYAFVLDDDLKVVWVNKMNPLFKDGIYNLLSVGMCFPCANFNSVEELAEGVIRTINQCK